MVDVPANTSTTSTISVGGTVNGVLEAPGDHDWYAITLTAGQSITINLTGTGTWVNAAGTQVSPDTYLNLRDAFGNIVAHNDDSGGTLDSKIVFTATSSGTYYIDAGAWDTQSQPVPSSTNQYTGGYTLSVQPYMPPPVWTDDQIANQLVNGFWNVQGGQTAHHFAVTQGGTITVNLTGLTVAGDPSLTSQIQNLARTALAEWSDIIGVTFREVTTGGQIVFHNGEDPASPGPRADTEAHFSNGIISSADVNISTSWVTRYGTGLNTYSFQTFIHEIGHALGLGHAGNYNGTADYAADALYANDAWSTTVMSYFDQQDNAYFTNLGFTKDLALTPMVADILAMQMLYGLSTTTRIGDTTYGFNSNAGRDVYNANIMQNVAYTIFDSGGNDTLDYSGTAATQTINLNPETFSNVLGQIGNVSIARGTIIENAIGGSGNDTIYGNDAANRLIGNAGNDTLFGGAGDDFLDGGPGVDQMTGGAGNDTFSGTKATLNGDSIMDFSLGDRIVFTDATLGSFSFSLAGNTLTYTGGSLAIATSSFSGTLTARASATGGVELTSRPFLFDSGFLKDTHFGAAPAAGGWSAQSQYPRELADVNGDGRLDVVAFGGNGVYVALGNADGTFSGGSLALSQFGAQAAAGGWASQDKYPRLLADVNGDGRADIVAFGQSIVYVALGKGDGSFAPAQAVTSDFTVAGGWATNDHNPRVLADVNGDGRADLVAFGDAGVYVALGNIDGTFAKPTLATLGFGAGATAGNWVSNDLYTRQVVDVNGDHRADIVAFGQNSVYVAFANADGTFAAPKIVTSEFTGSFGWSSDNVTPRELADVNGDGKVDLLGFGVDGLYVAFGNGDGTFQHAFRDVSQFGAGNAAGGWASSDTYPRFLADMNHDGAADVVAFGNDGIYVAYSHPNLFI